MVTACLLLIKEFIMARKWFVESLVQPCPVLTSSKEFLSRKRSREAPSQQIPKIWQNAMIFFLAGRIP
jgi:hypothetical protein